MKKKKIHGSRKVIKMKTLIVLVFSVLSMASCHNESVIIIGSKFIRPRQPYTVAFANPFNSNVELKLSLECDGGSIFWESSALMLERQSQKSFSYDIPDIADSQCFFSVVNDGGSVMVNHEVELLFPTKTLSIFILTDKPIYKPGDLLRFRVVVVDIATKPANQIETIDINLEDSDGESIKQWTQAKSHNGIFESFYSLASAASLGTWTITVTVKDNSVNNEKSQQFEVQQYVPPELFVTVKPSRTLLISDKQISLNITSYRSLGEPVQGIIKVELFTNIGSKAIDSKVGRFYNHYYCTFKLKENLLTSEHKDYALVWTKVSLTDERKNVTTIKSQAIQVFSLPYKITLINRVMHYRPGSTILCKLSVKDHNGLPVNQQGRSLTLKTDTDEGDYEGNLNNQGIASFILSMPNEITNVTISASFEGVEYDIAVIEGVETTSTQYLQIITKNSIVAERNVTFTISSNKYFSQLFYFVTSRGSIILNGDRKFNRRKFSSLKIKLSSDMAPHAKLVVYTFNKRELILDVFDMDFEPFGNEFTYMVPVDTYHWNQAFSANITAENEAYVTFQAINHFEEEFGLTKKRVFAELDEYLCVEFEEIDNIDDGDRELMQSFGLFLLSGDLALSFGSTGKRSSLLRTTLQTCIKPERHDLLKIELPNNKYPEAWLWKNITISNETVYTMTDLVPNKTTSWHVTGFSLSPSQGLKLMSAPQKITVDKPFNMVANIPPSIKRDAVSRIEVTLFNFLDQELPISVTLFNEHGEFEIVDATPADRLHSEDYTLVYPYQDEPITFLTKATLVLPHQDKLFTFLIKAKKLGEIVVKIEAESQLFSEGLEHVLLVTPESFLFEKTEARFFDINENGRYNLNLKLSIPSNTDPGMTKIFVTIRPLSFTSAPQSLESLFAESTGSTKYNILHFISNFFVLEYLKHSNRAFGHWDNDNGKSNVFLTALVANVINTASNHITMDYAVIIRAFSWLSGKQKSNGCFQEDGEIVYPPMQDRSSSYALTAFIVATAMENEHIASHFSTMVEKGSECLARNFDSLTKMHDIALAAYAFSLTKHDKLREARNKLIDESILDISHQYRYWDAELNVEIAGYTVLAYLANGFDYDATFFVQWLNKQSYSIDRFADVLRSFIACKAMVRLDTFIKKSDYRLIISSAQHSKPIYSAVLKNNNDSLNHELPHDARELEFKFEGVGIGLIQLEYQYQQSIQSIRQRFNINVEVLHTTNYNVLDLQVCLRYVKNQAYERTGLVLVEVYLPSGLVVNDNAVRDSSRKIKKTQPAFESTAMFVYYQELDEKQVCFDVSAHRLFDTEMHRPSYVVVNDTDNYGVVAIEEYVVKQMVL